VRRRFRHSRSGAPESAVQQARPAHSADLSLESTEAGKTFAFLDVLFDLVTFYQGQGAGNGLSSVQV
ncbi:MAG: hypothetical protein V3W02_01880, partial [Gammaproteobacteria bacterium]